MSARWRFPLFTIAAVAVVLMVLRVLDRAPVAVVPASQDNAFSADRAFAHLQTLLAENVPHPPGSIANRIIADRIEAALRTAGYEPEIQEGFKCSPHAPGCSVVRNVIAVRKGRDSSRAVMATAHYDSVPGSAAAADDGAGIATLLEIAERIARREPLLRDIVFLFADAEEAGLRGAMHFADSHPLMPKIAFVLNLEARGVAGPSLMFETGPNNSALIAAFADAVPNPVSNSLLFEAYQRMPNDTDFTIYKWKQVSGLNFAFARGGSLYHSERDDLTRLDKASVQHQGDNVSAALMRIANTPVDDLLADGDATYFDVGGMMLARWPSAWNPILASIGLVLVIIAAVRCARPRLRSAAWSVLAVLALIALLGGAGWLLSWPLGRWPGVHPLDHPYPWPARIALIASCLVVTLLVARSSSGRANIESALTVVWMLIALLALAASHSVPGVSYLLLVPLLVYGIGAVIESLLCRKDHGAPYVAAAAAFVIATYMALYHFLLLDVLFNFDMAHAKAIPLVLLALPLLPLAIAYVAREDSRLLLAAGCAIVAVASTAALLVPTHTIDRPRGVNLVYVQDDDANTAQWQIESFGDPGRETLEAMAFDTVRQPMLHFNVAPDDAHLKPAAHQDLRAPVVVIDEDIERGGKRIVRGSIRSQRQAYQLGLAYAAQSPVLALRVEDQPVIESASDEAQVIRFHGAVNAPVRFELAARPGEPLSLTAFDLGTLTSDGEAQKMLAMRPDTAAPVHGGDRAIVLSRVTL